MIKYFVILSLSVIFPAFGQDWENITPVKGATATIAPIDDKYGNVYVFTGNGVYKSSDKGVRWSKQGNLLEEIKKEHHNFYYENYTRIIRYERDTLFVTVEDNYISLLKTSYFFTNSKWQKYKYEQVKPEPVFTKSGFGGTLNFETIGGIPGNYFVYTSDAGKTWKHRYITKGIYPAPTFHKLKDSYYVFFKDSVFVTKTGEAAQTKKVKPFGYNATQVTGLQNNQLLTALLLRDSIGVYKFDTTNLDWIMITRKPFFQGESLSMNFNSIVIGGNSNIYVNVSGTKNCQDGLYFSSDLGVTWKRMKSTDPVFNGSNYILPVELQGKVYYYGYGIFQNTPDYLSDQFSATAPQDFGFQHTLYWSTRNLAGNHYSLFACQAGLYTEKKYWNGSGWAFVPNVNEVEKGPGKYSTYILTRHLLFNESVKKNMYGSNYDTYTYYMSKDEGFTWDSILNPSPAKKQLRFTEWNQKLFGVQERYMLDSVFVSDDLGKTWTVKKIPGMIRSTGFFPTANTNIDYYRNELYVLRILDNKFQLMKSSDLGTNWTDITYNLAGYKGESYYYLGRYFLNKSYPNLKYRVNVNGISKEYELTGNTWKEVTDGYQYIPSPFFQDTAVRIKENLQSEFFELSYDNKNWKQIRNFTGGDTLATNCFYNESGLFVNTNYGLFHSDFNNIITGSESANQKDIFHTMSPNPAEDFIKIDFKEPYVHYQIFDSKGRLLKEDKSSDSGVRVDLKGFSPGMYVMKINGTKTSIFKIIKK